MVQILEYYLAKTKPVSSIDSLVIARGTPGFTGADLENLVNIAALKASMNETRTGVENDDLEYAKDRILMGMTCYDLSSI